MVCNGVGDDLYNWANAHYARRSSGPKVMMELIRLFSQIALLRRGPQDVPASPVLLTVTVAVYFVINVAVTAILPPDDGPVVARSLLDVAFMLVWYFLLLKVVGKSERILQTTTAVFGFQAVLSPVLVASGWLIRRFQQDAVWQVPASLIGLALLIWYIAANGHVVKAALEWSSTASVALVILQLVTGELLVLALFPSGT